MRIQGYREGLEAAGHDPGRHPIYLGNYRIDSGYELTLRVMRGKKPPTALLLGNDQMATGAYLALARLGVRIPDDVSVVGYDDEPIAADLTPGADHRPHPLLRDGPDRRPAHPRGHDRAAPRAHLRAVHDHPPLLDQPAARRVTRPDATSLATRTLPVDR